MSERKKPFKILVAIDFSEYAHAALRRAIEVAGWTDGTLVLVHAVDTATLVATAGPTMADSRGLTLRIREDAEEALRKLARTVDPESQRIHRVEIADGSAAPAIVEAARRREADLIAIGTHGRTGLARFFIGSVAERVARTAPCDVLIVRLPPPAEVRPAEEPSPE